MAFNCRKFITSIALLLACATFAQQNTFLEREYWKSSPDITKIEADIAKGNDPTQLNANAFDPTVYAINENAPNETIKHLLSKEGNGVNKITHDGRTYIFWAAYKGNTEIMEYLLAKGAKTDILDDHGYTIMNFAAANGQTNTEVYDICLAKGANLKKDLDHDGANALLLSATNDKELKLFDYFTSKGLSIKSTDAKGNTILDYAAKNGNTDNMDTLLKKGAKFTNSAMIMASQGTRTNTNTVATYRYLESKGVKPNTVSPSGDNALHAIVRKAKDLEIINYFLSKGVDVNQTNQDGNNVLMNAAASNPLLEIAALLLSKTKNINQTNAKGASALLIAIQSNSPEVVQLFLDKGADVSISDKEGNNAAYYLIQSYSTKKATEFDLKLLALKQKGFDISKAQSNGNTLFHLAVAKNELNLVKRASELNIDINAQNKEGMTALHKAAMIAKNDEIMKYLISIGAKKDAVTDMKETAFDLASENEALQKDSIPIDFLKS